MVYEIWFQETGVRELVWETDNLTVASILFDYMRVVCRDLNNTSLRFNADVFLETREI